MKTPRHHHLDDKLHAVLLGTVIAIGLAIGCAIANVAADTPDHAPQQSAAAPATTTTAVAALGVH